jgi:hypothetical protein
MKSLILMFIYTATFMGVFFSLSLIGLLWHDSYHAIVSDGGWFMAYTIFLGWWIAMFPTREYYKHHEQYFNEYF